MPKLPTLICLSLLILFPVQTIADTVILKNGKTIQSEKCWEDGELIKCKLYGQIIGYSKSDIAEYRLNSKPVPKTKGFKFDIWSSGLSVNEVIDIAEANNKPLHRDGLISSNKVFNPKMCRPYADTATKFYYKDQIFGKWAKLNLNFTPSTKRLYSIYIAFSGPGISKKSEFRDQIEAMLREKYGNNPKISNQVVFQNYNWKVNENASVTMRVSGNRIQIIYVDQALSKIAENEKLERVRKGFSLQHPTKINCKLLNRFVSAHEDLSL